MNSFEEGLALCRTTPGALLIDLRDPEDYGAGRIPGAVNLSLNTLREDLAEIAEPDTPLFLYCYAGMRSWQAEALLPAMGYENVHSIGGIDGYRGELEEPEDAR